MAYFGKLLLSSAAVVVVTHGQACAQLVPQATEARNGAPSGESEQADGLADIVVTAQKHSENLQRTAAAITAVSGDVLVNRGVLDIRDAQMVVPAARFQNEANSTQIFVRGVGANLDFPSLEPAVAFNFNGVSVPRESTSSAFFDIARMEVLPGPQGTLYGRGAMGGTLNVQFRRPEFNNEGNFIIEAGNYSLVHGSLAQNLALSDTLAVRVAADYINHDGYFTSGADAADNVAVRGSLLYKPSDNFSAYVWGSAAWKNGTTPNAVNHSPAGFLTGNPWDDIGATRVSVDLANYLRSIGSPLPFTVGLARGEKNDYDAYSAGGEFNLKLGDGLTLTYIPGYNRVKSRPLNWLGSLLFTNVADIESHSHELRLAGETGRLQWLAGLFYYHQRNSGHQTFFFGGPDFPNGPTFQASLVQYGVDVRRNILEGEGIFGQATWKASDALRLTLGGRYSHDRREANGFNPEYRFLGTAPGTGPFTAPGANTAWSFEQGYSYFDWKAAIEYDVASKVMLYATAQTGHAPGTYNAISQAGLDAGDPFDPSHTPFDGSIAVKQQKLTAFTAGFKSRFAQNTVQLNVEGFYYTFNNLIQQQFDATKLFNPVFNANKVEIYGVQADLLWQPTPDDKLSGTVGYTHARSKLFVTPSGADYSGLQPPYAPDWTLLGSYTHSFRMGDDATLDATVAARYESSWFADYSHTTGTEQSASAKLDASLTYDSGRNWQFGVWGKNVTNKAVLAATAAAGVPGPAIGYLEAPRTYGARFMLKY